MIKNTNLRRNLGATNDSYKWALWVREDRGKSVNLFLKQEASVCRKVSCWSNNRALCTVSGTKGIKNKDVTIRCKGLCNLWIVLLLTLVKTDVLKNKNLAVLECVYSLTGLLAIGVLNKLNLAAKKLSKLLCSWAQGKLWLEAGAIWTAKVAHQDDLCVVVEKILDGWKCSANAGVVSNNAVL